ncbi:MAG: SAM-dependent methyltransferase [Waddliaceae bacterium]|nr:SAM-dependent methyltransferase [Waddliaceae bacterium]
MTDENSINSIQTLATYQSLCAEYYDLDKPNAPEDALSLYESYARLSKGPILEPMCGSGRFLIPLLQKGFNICGFDASSYMLEALEIKAASLSLQPQITQGFLHDFKAAELFSLIFIPSGSFGLITDPEEALLGLRNIYELLLDGGTFVFEAETPNASPTDLNVWKGSVQKRADGKLIILSTLSLPLKGGIDTTICKYELVDEASVTRTEIEKLQVRLYEPSELCTLLQKVGFKTVRMVKAFTSASVPDENDEVIIYECKK